MIKLQNVFLFAIALCLMSCADHTGDSSPSPDRSIYKDNLAVKGQFVINSGERELDSEIDKTAYDALLLEYPRTTKKTELLSSLQLNQRTLERVVVSTPNRTDAGIRETITKKIEVNKAYFFISNRQSTVYKNMGEKGTRNTSDMTCATGTRNEVSCQWQSSEVDFLPDETEFWRIYNAATGLSLISDCYLNTISSITTTAVKGTYALNGSDKKIPAIKQVEIRIGEVACAFYKHNTEGPREQRVMGMGQQTRTVIIADRAFANSSMNGDRALLEHFYIQLNGGEQLYLKIDEILGL